MSKVLKNGCKLPSHSDSQELHSAQIKKMYITSVLWSALIVFVVFSAVIGLVSFILTEWIPAVVFSLLFLAAIAALLLIRGYFQSHAVYRMHRFECKDGNIERLVSHFSAKQYSIDYYEGKAQRYGIYCTVSIVQMEYFGEGSFKELRSKMKGASCDRKKTVGLFTGGKYAKICFIVCHGITEKALIKIAENARKNLNRTECLFYAVLSLEEASLYVPVIYDGLEHLQVKRYATFCDMVTEAVM